jgi:hypothetical protein
MSAPQKKKSGNKKKDLPESNVEMPIVETETPIVETETPVVETEQIEPIITPDQIVNEIKEEIEQEIKEKIDEVITVKIPMNLVDLVKEEIKQKTHILNKEYIDILNSLVGKSPKLLNDIEHAMIEITKDGKIDSNDIPFLITIIQKLYEFMFSLKIGKMPTEKRAAICAEIIKFVVVVLIKERRIKVDVNKQDVFIAQINALMDSCVSLLSLQSNLLSKGCCSCFFGKK